MLFRASMLLGLCSAVVFACGGGDNETPAISGDEACTQLATALCNKLNECVPFFVNAFIGDQTTCLERYKKSCAPTFTATGSSATPAQTAQCAAAAKTMTCDDALSRKLPEACRTTPGTLDDGAPCGVDSQCKNKLCRTTKGAACGACSKTGGSGSACQRDEECDYELSCVQGKCIAKGKAGASCTITDECLGTLGCSDGVCATPLAAGAACTIKKDQNPCSFAQGQYCHPRDKVCAQVGTAAAGGQCELSAEQITICSAGATCSISGGAVGQGTCQAPAADGATCSDTGPSCLAPARCVNGVCTISDPAACK